MDLEDIITPLVWITLAFGAVAYNAAMKRRKGAGKEEQPPRPHREAWPGIPWPAETRMHPAEAEEARPDDIPSMAAYSTAEDADSEDLPAYMDAAASSQPATTLTETDFAASSPRPETVTVDAGSIDADTAGASALHTDPETEATFDLRQAVIYAEILKPKFEAEND